MGSDMEENGIDLSLDINKNNGVSNTIVTQTFDVDDFMRRQEAMMENFFSRANSLGQSNGRKPETGVTRSEEPTRLGIINNDIALSSGSKGQGTKNAKSEGLLKPGTKRKHADAFEDSVSVHGSDGEFEDPETDVMDDYGIRSESEEEDECDVDVSCEYKDLLDSVDDFQGEPVEQDFANVMEKIWGKV